MTKRRIKKNNNRERDRFTVVLESIQSDFRAFGEKLDFIDKRLDGMDGRLAKIEFRLDKIELILSDIKSDIADIKRALDKKADLERLERLEKRVRQIEIVLARKS